MQITYRVQGMDCINCAQTLEKGIQQLTGVNQVQVDFAGSKLHIEGDIAYSDLEQRVKALGYSLVSLDSRHHQGMVGFWQYLISRTETRLALIGGGLTLAILGMILIGLPTALTNLLLIGAMGITAYPIARSGINNLLINRDFNINLLMTIAAIGAIVIGEYLESATVVFLFAIGEALEGYSADRARNSIRSLMELAPPQAIRLKDSKEETVPVEILAIDDVILVKPGELIPMDGVVTRGASAVNQAAITGESKPVVKEKGTEVFAGSINGLGVLEVRVTQLATDNTINRIIKLVEEAQSVRAPSQRFIDQFARWYTPLIVVIAILVGTIPPLVFDAPFWNPVDGEHGWLYRALALLVIACPCALVISAPVTIISAITAGARQGVLIKGGVHLEAIAGIRAIAFDKTGTLTCGEPAVITSRAGNCLTQEACPLCDDILALAAALERRSTHPLAKAVVNAAEQRGLIDSYAAAEEVNVMAGLGMQGRVNNRLITIGSHRLFDEKYPHSDKIHTLVNEAEARGQTTMLLHDTHEVLGYIAFNDQVREESRQVIKEIKALGITTIMLTGDNSTVAQTVSQEVGIDEVKAELLPEDKADTVKSLLAAYQHVAMVGDGVNDAPALATATVGVAMGGAGSAQALETADLVLMGDDLRQLPFTIKLARFARSLIAQNVAVSLGIKVCFLILALAGVATLWTAILADMGTSLLVTMNGMRPLAFSRQPKDEGG